MSRPTTRRRATKRRNSRSSGGLTKAVIARTIKQIEEYAGDKAAEKPLILAVARGQRDLLSEVRAAYKRERGEAAPRDMKAGRIFKAHSIADNYYAFDGDLVGVFVDGRGIPYAYEHTGDYHPIGPADVVLAKSTFIDENAEPTDPAAVIDNAVNGGSGRGGWDSHRYNGRKRPAKRRKNKPSAKLYFVASQMKKAGPVTVQSFATKHEAELHYVNIRMYGGPKHIGAGKRPASKSVAKLRAELRKAWS